MAIFGSHNRSQSFSADDAACAAYLEKTRWSGGFICPPLSGGGRAVPLRGDPQVAEEYLPIIHLVFANGITAPTYAELCSCAWKHPIGGVGKTRIGKEYC